MPNLEIGCEQIRQRAIDSLDLDDVAMVAHERPSENVYSIKVSNPRATMGRQDENDEAMANVFCGDGHGGERECCGRRADAYDGQRGGVI